MRPDHADNWIQANQRCLMEAIAHIREHLGKHARRDGLKHPVSSGAESTSSDLSDTFGKAQQRPSFTSALATLSGAFRLSSFERDILLLCAGVELDSALASLVTTISGDARHPAPTFSLALAALPDPHWSALSPAGPLRRFRMIEVSPGLQLTTSPLKIDERILHYLTGVACLDERLNGMVEKVQAQERLATVQEAIVRRIIDLCAGEKSLSRLPVIGLTGSDPAAQKDIAARVCRKLGLNLYVLAADHIPLTPLECAGFIRLWEREAFLTQSALLLDFHASDPADKAHEHSVTRLMETAVSMIFFAAPDRKQLVSRRQSTFDVVLPTAAEQRALWLAALGDEAARLDGGLDHLTSQFQLSPQAIRASCDEALACGTDKLEPALWEAYRKQARPRLEQLACRIEPKAFWDDLVLPPMQKETLQAVAANVRLRHRVYDIWGFAEKSARGLGISALFAGASGTGKTLAAEVLANDLRLDLFRIDLSQVVNKYIGETEKNLKRVFDAAEAGGAILLFDEADALFGKRSEVKDSHDRYANIEVSYLLQRMESYRGLAILTTNMKEALDTAFLRRIRFIVQFPFPDATQRAEIWRRIFPADTPTDRLDPARLSLLQVAGGNIRNIALTSAFIAADGNRPVDMTHIRQAVKREYAKMEKQLSAAEMSAFTE